MVKRMVEWYKRSIMGEWYFMAWAGKEPKPKCTIKNPCPDCKEFIEFKKGDKR